jgi:hypothetical protein
MTENGYVNGQQIKIGTCENMYYLRPDQIKLVQSTTLRDLTNLRFRFPFPDEDNVPPGEFSNHDRGLAVWKYDVPDGIKHYRVQFRATAGILVNLPCPHSADGKSSGITYLFNGYHGPARIVQQRIWAGRWATVMACGPCNARYRLPDLAAARPLLDAIETEVTHAEHDKALGRAVMWRTVAERIEAGYHTPTDSDPDRD